MAQAFGFRRCLRLAKASVSRHGLHASLLGGSIAGAATLCKAETQVDTLTRLGELDTCALCDASGKKARVITTVRPLKPGYRMAGRVRTVAVDGDFLEILAVLREVQPGEVVMIDASMRGGPEDSTWPRSGGLFGELLASEAQRRGVRGMVVDGNCRDTPMLRQMSLPVFCRGHHPNAGFAQKRGTSQVEIRMGGVSVKPGEYVLGDDDGVVVCSQQELQEWLAKAEAIQRQEEKILSHIQQGGDLFERLPNFQEHLEAASQGKVSQLKLQ
ncbi:unnamed protein product [Effrenium voratum]|uniref:Dimethylmenaquinone methyltransferase n=1 Tax=Effrenium voratum TaxID=2562239 RepID=A0AA36N7Z6_9DINO|nr:unnamed protein product [Effrenium voratum]CAJ1446071.1 unnamed protein product [Effrenium voratum]